MRLRLTLFVLFIGLAAFAPAAKAVTQPLIVQRCDRITRNVGAPTSLTCHLSNVTSGNKLILDYYGIYGTAITFTTATESFTCPAGSKASDSGIREIGKCFLTLASSHSDFVVTLTASGAPPAGGSAQMDMLMVREYQGLGTEDTGARQAAIAGATLSLSTTTANANEWVDASCLAFSNNIVPGSNYSQMDWGEPKDTSTQDFNMLAEYRIVAAASTTTTACTLTNGLGAGNGIAILAFQQSSPPTVPAVNQIQSCVYSAAASASGVTCDLHNTLSGSKIVWGYTASANSAPGGFTCAATETCVCTGGSQATVAGVVYQIGICYSDTASSHATFTASVSASSPITFNVDFLQGFEISGLSSGVDVSASAAATSVSYTPTRTDWAFMFAADDAGNQMLAGNSFLNSQFSIQTLTAHITQAISAYLSAVAPGSQTASYTQTGSANPMIAVAGFAPSASPNVPRRKGWIGK